MMQKLKNIKYNYKVCFKLFNITFTLLLLMLCQKIFSQQNQLNISKVKETKGLIAFWDFNKTDTFLTSNKPIITWSSWYDKRVMNASLPLFLKRSDDTTYYGIKNWPYKNAESQIKLDQNGPFGNSLKCNLGYIYGETPRSSFENTALDISGKKAFTLLAWAKFTGSRHFIAGIWDEGGWDKYAGRRQYALFGGLFGGQKGALAHISGTGAASFPQSLEDGSQYARMRAIDASDFENNEWHCLAMTYEPKTGNVKAWLDGSTTQCFANDPVYQDVFQFDEEISANPFTFDLPIFHPKNFVLKFNGYDYLKSTKEIYLIVDLKNSKIKLACIPNNKDKNLYAIAYYKNKNDSSESIQINLNQQIQIGWPNIQIGDTITAILYKIENDISKQLGSKVEHVYTKGASFSFGRALGLGNNDLEHGSQLFIGGVAVFNRCLNANEIKNMAFAKNSYFEKIETGNQIHHSNNFDQTLHFSFSNHQKLEDHQLIVIFRDKNLSFPITGKDFQIRIPEIPYNKKIQDGFEHIHFQILNHNNDIIEEWKGKRMFRILVKN